MGRQKYVFERLWKNKYRADPPSFPNCFQTFAFIHPAD